MWSILYEIEKGHKTVKDDPYFPTPEPTFDPCHNQCKHETFLIIFNHLMSPGNMDLHITLLEIQRKVFCVLGVDKAYV